MRRKKRKELNRRLEKLGLKGTGIMAKYGGTDPENYKYKEFKILGEEESVRNQPKVSNNLKEKKKVDEK
ncbi:MAG: hypothetical protein ACFFD2_10195 [Promethearchaeota archaeon]